MAKYESFFLISSHLFSMHKIVIMFSRIFTNGLDHPTRHTHYDGICRNIMRNNSAASDNAIISDCGSARKVAHFGSWPSMAR